MAGAYIGPGSTATFSSGGTTQSITSDANLPASHAAGNLMILFIKSGAATARPDYTVTGWDQAARATELGVTYGVVDVWTKVATSNTRADDLPIEIVFSAAPTGSSITRAQVHEVSDPGVLVLAEGVTFPAGDTVEDQSPDLSVDPPTFILQFMLQTSTTGTLNLHTSNGFAVGGADTNTPTSAVAHRSSSLGTQPMPAWNHANATTAGVGVTLVLSDGLKRPYPRAIFF